MKRLLIGLLILMRPVMADMRDVAWKAYEAAQDGRKEGIPELAAFVAKYENKGAQPYGKVTEERAAAEAVADALIQLGAELPAATVMHLYPELPAQALILLSRSPDNSAALLQIFKTTRDRNEWLAAGNLLAVHPPAEFVRSLVGGVIVTFVIVAVSPGNDFKGFGEGCSADSGIVPDSTFANWPNIRMYFLDTKSPRSDVFAPGIHPVGAGFWVTTDYKNILTDGDCLPSRSKSWRIGLIAQLEHKSLDELALKPEVNETVTYLSDDQLTVEVGFWVAEQIKAYQETVQTLGLNPAEFQLKCRIIVSDQRRDRSGPLPELNGKWCPAPTAAQARPADQR